MTAALALESLPASDTLRRAVSFDVVHARRARRLLRRRAGGAVVAVHAFECSRSSLIRVPIARRRVHNEDASVKARARGVRTQDRACATPGPTAKQAPRPTGVVHVDAVRESTRERREREARSLARRSRRLLRLRARLRYVERRRAPFRSPLEAGAPKLMLWGALGRRREIHVERHGVPRPRGGRAECVSATSLCVLIRLRSRAAVAWRAW